jgi:energy-converting hydrogenase Eha subunit A
MAHPLCTTRIPFEGGRTCPDPYAGKDGVEVSTVLSNAKIEHPHFARRKDRMPAPIPAAVVALGITLHHIILVIGASDIPHLQFAVVIGEVGFVDAAVFPFFSSSETGSERSFPGVAIPLHEIRSSATPEILGVIQRSKSALPIPACPGPIPSHTKGSDARPYHPIWCSLVVPL